MVLRLSSEILNIEGKERFSDCLDLQVHLAHLSGAGSNEDLIAQKLLSKVAAATESISSLVPNRQKAENYKACDTHPSTMPATHGRTASCGKKRSVRQIGGNLGAARAHEFTAKYGCVH